MRTPKMMKRFALMAVLSPIAMQAFSPSALASDELATLEANKTKSLAIIQEARESHTEKSIIDKEQINAEISASQADALKQLKVQVQADIAKDIEKQVSEIEAPEIEPALEVEKREEVASSDSSAEETLQAELAQEKLQRELAEEALQREIAQEQVSNVEVATLGKSPELLNILDQIGDSEASLISEAKSLEEQIESEQASAELIEKVNSHNQKVGEVLIQIEALQEAKASELSEEDTNGLDAAKESLANLRLEAPQVEQAQEEVAQASDIAASLGLESDSSEEEVVEAEVEQVEDERIVTLKKKNHGLETIVCEQENQLSKLGEEIEALKNASSPMMEVMNTMQQLMMMNMMMAQTNNNNQISYAGNSVDTMGQMMAPMMMMQSMNMMMMQSMGLGVQQHSMRDLYSKTAATPMTPQNIYNVDGNYYAGNYSMTNSMQPQQMAQQMPQQIPYQGAPYAFDFNERQPSFENIKAEGRPERPSKAVEPKLEEAEEEMV
ncbi:MAG: hypothetical protein KC478_10940 [Bacteriovoracaceae bacterium]|nr:hypothetical protein [Bacteriovoracaceae bacterium]